MTPSTSKLSQRLFDRLYTTTNLKAVVDCLDALSRNQTFKDHAHHIVTDQHLTDGQKITQLLYLLRAIEQPVLYDFFTDILDRDHLWLFHHDKLDYFDRFIQEFQNLADDCRILYLITAVALSDSDLVQIIKQVKDGLGFRVLVDVEINPTLLGGAQIKLENYLFDVSVRHQLHQFQTQWLKSLDETKTLVGQDMPG